MKQRTCWSGKPESKWQMELGFGSSPACAGKASRARRRISRAHWWFNRMRQVVDRALDEPPAPAKPVQIGLPDSDTPRRAKP